MTIICLREKQMVAVLSRLLEGKWLTIIALETLVTRGVATHALLLLFYDLLSFLREGQGMAIPSLLLERQRLDILSLFVASSLLSCLSRDVPLLRERQGWPTFPSISDAMG